GYSTVRAQPGEEPRKRFWHFGLQAKPVVAPTLAYTMKGHVLFSDDRERIWDSATALHRARRSQCRNWWNDRWRDLILATLSWLAGGARDIELPVSSSTALRVSATPELYRSPVSYHDEEATEPLEEADPSDYEEEDEEAEEEEG
ncbi:MAG: hypothetical protein ACREA0_16405, partial [bacterium]